MALRLCKPTIRFVLFSVRCASLNGHAHRTVYSLGGTATCGKGLSWRGGFRIFDALLKTSPSSKSLHWQRRGSLVSNKATRVVLGAVGVSAGVAVVGVCARTLHAMSAGPKLNLDSGSGEWKVAKNMLLSMDKEKRREVYRVDFIPLEQIPVWTPIGHSSCKPLYEVDEKLNLKISLFSGDITKLEIDAIANAANKTLLGGGGVDGAIHRGAGPLLRKECTTLYGCETGEAKITGAYGLPAKYVIHTVGPIVHDSVQESEERALRNCYYNCLLTATSNLLRTVAFPCISTGVYGYPPDQAVKVALKTVREFLEQNPNKLDRVIFCVFLKSDKELYEKTLPAYFPQAVFASVSPGSS